MRLMKYSEITLDEIMQSVMVVVVLCGIFVTRMGNQAYSTWFLCLFDCYSRATAAYERYQTAAFWLEKRAVSLTMLRGPANQSVPRYTLRVRACLHITVVLGSLAEPHQRELARGCGSARLTVGRLFLGHNLPSDGCWKTLGSLVMACKERMPSSFPVQHILEA